MLQFRQLCVFLREGPSINVRSLPHGGDRHLLDECSHRNWSAVACASTYVACSSGLVVTPGY
jgi:hypothetical protein